MSDPHDQVQYLHGRLNRLGSSALRVREGEVFVLAQAANGKRFGLGRLGPESVIAPLPDVELLVSFGLEASVAEVELSQCGPEELAAFVDLVKTAVGDEPKRQDSAEPVVQEDLPALARELRQEVDRRVANYDGQVKLARELDALEIELSTARDLRAIRSPEKPSEPVVPGGAVGAIVRIAKYNGFEVESPERYEGMRADDVLAALRLRSRTLKLQGSRWPIDPPSALLAKMRSPSSASDAHPADGSDLGEAHLGEKYVALIPDRGRFLVFDPDTSTSTPLTAELQSRLGLLATEIATPLPSDRPVTLRDLARLGLQHSRSGWLLVAALALGAALLALATPLVTQTVVSYIVPSANNSLLVAVGVALVMAAVASAVFVAIQTLAISRINQRTELRVQTALMDRTLALPISFFRQYSSGDLAMRVMSAQALTNLLSASLISQLFAAVFSIVNFVLLFIYSPQLAVAALLIIIVSVVYLLFMMRGLRALGYESTRSQRESSAWIIQLLSGISKVRMAGVEDRLVALNHERIRQVIEVQARQTLLNGRVRGFFVVIGSLTPAVFFATILIFGWSPSGPQIDAAAYLAFVTAFGTVFGAIVGLVAALMPLATAGPLIDSARPILEGLPEASGDFLPDFKGEFELKNVSFRYGEDLPQVLDDVSLRIEPGEYVAIVGRSGSGKSTLLRLLLAFETPSDGALLVDGRVLADLDAVRYRANLGVVVQDGSLLPSTVLDNILLGAPLPESAAWDAADKVGLEREISAMPMGMQTLIDSATVSGGQAQRILIARALCRKPKCILLDEATSALDNENQARVTSTLGQINATRVVIAHRLSTIVDADRILVMDRGKLIEQGTFSELIERGGHFAALASRQLV